MEIEIPRRLQLDMLTREESEIFDVIQHVEYLGAHPLLTEVVVLLDRARNQLADWVELQNSEK